uniref:Uncharacterized protein n=1 Tax=Romanomermis culicivorax TaxID=13658 RepID=A0A915HEX0_ROMCU
MFVAEAFSDSSSSVTLAVEVLFASLSVEASETLFRLILFFGDKDVEGEMLDAGGDDCILASKSHLRPLVNP